MSVSSPGKALESLVTDVPDCSFWKGELCELNGFPSMGVDWVDVDVLERNRTHWGLQSLYFNY